MFLTNEDFTPPIGTFEFGILNSNKVKHCIEIANKLGSFHNCIKDEIFSTTLALRLNCQIPLWNFTFSEEMHEKWNWQKDIGSNLFDNKFIFPADRIIKVSQDEDDDYSYTICSFFGGPFPEDIGMYIFECWKFMNQETDIKKFMNMIGNNTLEIYNHYKEVEPRFKQIQKELDLKVK